MNTGDIRAIWTGYGDGVGKSDSVTSIPTKGESLHSTPGSYSYLKFVATNSWPWNRISGRTRWRILWVAGNKIY